MRWKASQERQQRIGQGGMTLARACVFSGAGRPAVHSKCASSVRIEEMTSPLLPGACAVTSHPFDGIRSSTSLEPCLDSYQGSSRRQNGAKAQKDRETTAGTETEDTYLFEKEGTVWGSLASGGPAHARSLANGVQNAVSPSSGGPLRCLQRVFTLFASAKGGVEGHLPQNSNGPPFHKPSCKFGSLWTHTEGMLIAVSSL